MIGRRAFILGGAAGLGALAGGAGGYFLPRLGGTSFGRELGPVVAPVADPREVAAHFVAAERPAALPCFGRRTLPLWTYAEGAFPPVIRMRLGDRLVARLENRLPVEGQHTSIHWHGIRNAIDEDGVPYVTQPPVNPGESFTYSFEPPDAGTFFFHSHCNTAEQLGRGLAGILIVEGDEVEPYDGERLIVLRDWRVGEDGFLPFLTDEGATRAGTFGTVRSTNGAINPVIPVPAGADIRLRILNVDPTRIMQIGIEDADAAVIAVDGIACPPFPLRTWKMGTAMRIDVAVRTPADGGTARLVDYFAPSPVPLARLAAKGPGLRTRSFDPSPLKAGRVPGPDLDTAERRTFNFSATPTGDGVRAAAEPGLGPLGSLCLADRSFWAINKQAWPGQGHETLPPPISILERGKSYVFELINATPVSHPIHIHGFIWTYVGTNETALPPHHTDTVLIRPKERVEVAFVADNPGDWMFHCHLIEHQETGMMSILRVT